MGLRKLKEVGVAVFQTSEEEESESTEETQRWARPALHKLLVEGPGFGVTPGMVAPQVFGKASRGQRNDCVQIIVPDRKGVDEWWKECKTRRGPK